MPKFPVDAPREGVLKALQRLGFGMVVWAGNPIANHKGGSFHQQAGF
jgi:hypothetical protein